MKIKLEIRTIHGSIDYDSKAFALAIMQLSTQERPTAHTISIDCYIDVKDFYLRENYVFDYTDILELGNLEPKAIEKIANKVVSALKQRARNLVRFMQGHRTKSDGTFFTQEESADYDAKILEVRKINGNR